MKLIRSLFSFVILSLTVGCCVNIPDTSISKFSNPVPNKTEKTHREIVKKIENLTVGLMRKDYDGESYIYCAGVWAAKGYILTAGHCALSDNPANMSYIVINELKEKKLHEAYAMSIDIANDLALIKVSAKNEPDHENVIFTLNEQINPGDEVNIVGHPVGFEWSYIKGYVSAVRDNFFGPVGNMEKLIQISSPAWMGNSGGGAFDDKGNFVGLCSWVSKQGPFLSFFVHRDVVKNFLKKEGVLKEF